MRRLVDRGHAAAAGHVEVELAGGAHDQGAAGGDGDGLAGGIRGARRFAGMDAGENDRRLAGIGRRSDPGVDPEICRQHHALPVECRGDALPALAAGGDESGDAGDEDEGAQRIGIARGHARRRPTRLEGSRGGARALDVGVP